MWQEIQCSNPSSITPNTLVLIIYHVSVHLRKAVFMFFSFWIFLPLTPTLAFFLNFIFPGGHCFFFFWKRLNWFWMASAAFSVSGASRSMSTSSSCSWGFPAVAFSGEIGNGGGQKLMHDKLEKESINLSWFQYDFCSFSFISPSIFGVFQDCEIKR